MTESGAIRTLLAVGRAIDTVLEWVAEATSWLFLVLVFVICFDVVTRKFGIQVPGFGSTFLQEAEWHLHTLMFAGWLGYCYLHNAHVRVDMLTENVSRRGKAWIELAGCLFLAAPYCLVVLVYGFDFVARSWAYNETSDAAMGIPYRWAIKGLLVAGLGLLFASVLSVAIKCAAFLLRPGLYAERRLPIDSRIVAE